MKKQLVLVAVLGFSIPAFADNLSTGIAAYTVLEQSGPATGNTGPGQIVTSSNADWYGGWVPNSALSSWIAYDPNNAFDNGLGTYSTTFTLTPG